MCNRKTWCRSLLRQPATISQYSGLNPIICALVVNICVALLTVMAAHAEEPSYRARSQDMGIHAFDLSVTETKRTDRTSVLNVPGFHARTAQGSRWLMCVYTDLALKRGFRWWTVVYPNAPSEEVLVGFLKAESESPTQTLGAEFGGKNVLPPAPVDKYAVLCNMGRLYR